MLAIPGSACRSTDQDWANMCAKHGDSHIFAHILCRTCGAIVYPRTFANVNFARNNDEVYIMCKDCFAAIARCARYRTSCGMRVIIAPREDGLALPRGYLSSGTVDFLDECYAYEMCAQIDCEMRDMAIDEYEARFFSRDGIRVQSGEVARKTLTHGERMRVYWRYMKTDDELCKCCGICRISPSNFECAHVVARIVGGPTDIANLRPTCGSCNRHCARRDLLDFARELRAMQEDVRKKVLSSACSLRDL